MFRALASIREVEAESSPMSSGAPSIMAFESIAESPRNVVQGMTSVIVRNIPNKATQRMVLNTLRQEGFAQTFDLIFMPMDNTNGCNLGYVFINFIDEEYCADAMKVFNGYKMSTSQSNKTFVVEHAKVQGYATWLEQIMTIVTLQQEDCAPENQPLLFDTENDCEIAFPSVENEKWENVASLKEVADITTAFRSLSVEFLDELMSSLEEFVLDEVKTETKPSVNAGIWSRATSACSEAW